MITVIRTATAFPGMTGEAIAWAKEIATIVKRATGKEQIVCTAFAGLLAEIAWIGHYDGVGEYDELRAKVIRITTMAWRPRRHEIFLFRVASAIRFGGTNSD
jgi:hypothetical protein